MNQFLVVSFLLLISISSFGQSNQKIELIDLVKIFIADSEYSYKDWFTGAEDNTPILWETEGTDFVDVKDFNYVLGAFVRKGKVIITLNNNPLYVLAKKKEIVSWDINIYGPRIGIKSLYLTNDLLSYDNCFENECVESYFANKGTEIKLLLCDNENSLTYGRRFYEIKIKDRPKMFLTVDFSCGSAGCSGHYIFHFDYPEEEYFVKQELKNTVHK